jgi:hypothetical protein
MPSTDVHKLARLVQPLTCILEHRFKQSIAHTARLRRNGYYERLIYKSPHKLQQIVAVDLPSLVRVSANGLRRIEDCNLPRRLTAG